ncbi:protein kinase domain-containing protein [Gemmata sp.]|uniref:protein kinase domain-containing protein n=1 Tax=Gemmata sp. TaxID=1914242 RepID=UPI003F71938A
MAQQSAAGTLAQSPEQVARAAAASGTLIPGYEIEGELGRGGMGVVYKARQVGLNRVVALKMVIAGPYADPVTRARFLLEAESVAALEHPHVVRVFAFGEHNGLPYLSMEFLPGGTLASRLKQNGPLAARQAAGVVAKLAAAVAHAHSHGIVHRDIKPGNILLSADGEPRLADFGLAKVGRSDLTGSGAILGTPAYMSPEQAAGKVREVGTPSDVYAVGAVLYDLLTGRPPFLADSAAVTLQQVLTAEPERLRKWIPSIPRDLETVCLKCLAKEPAKRYPTAQALADDLNHFLIGEPISARPAGPLERVVKWVRRRPAAARVLGLGLIAVMVILGLALKHRVELREADERERLAGVRAELADEQTRRARAERAAADRAADAQEFFRLVTQARNRRLNGRLGWTWAAREDLTHATRLAHDPARATDLRDEMVASLTALDAREVAQWKLPERTEDGHFLAAHPTLPLVAATQFAFPGWTEGFPQLSVWLLDSATGQLVHTLRAPVDLGNTSPGGSKESPAGLAFSPDGRWLVMSSRAGRLHRWAVSGPAPGPVTTWSGRGHGGAAAFSPDSRSLYTRCGRWLQVWDTGTWKETAARELGADVRTITPVPAAESLVLALLNQILFLDQHDLSDLRPPLPIGGHTSVTVGPDGRTALAVDGSQVVILDLVSRARSGAIDYRPAPGSGVPTTGISPDGRFAVVSPGSRGLVLHDLGSGRRVCELPVPDREPGPPFTFSPDGKRLYVGGRNQGRVYELSGPRTVALGSQQIARFGTSPDARTLYTVAGHASRPGNEGSELGVWAAAGSLRAPVSRRAIPFGHARVPFVAPVQQPDGLWLASGAGGRGIAWNLGDGTSVEFPIPHTETAERSVCFGPSGSLWVGGEKAIAYSLPGMMRTGAEYSDPLVGALRGRGSASVVTGGRAGILAVTGVGGLAWLNEKGHPLATWFGGAASVLALSPDEPLALVGSHSGAVGIYRLPTGESVATWPAHTERVTAACWLGPREFATASSDKTLTLWRVSPGSPVKLFTIPTRATVSDLARVVGGGLAVLETESRVVTVIDLPELTRELAARMLGVSLTVDDAFPTDPVTPYWAKLAPAATNGLRAEYFCYSSEAPDELTHALTQIEPEPGGAWGQTRPNAEVRGEHFRVCYRGWIKAPRPGRYVLGIEVDDEARVYLDGKPVGDRVAGGRGEIPLALSDRPHRLRIEYAQTTGPAALRVTWSRPEGFAARPLGPAVFPDRTTAENAVVPDPQSK